MNKAHEHGHGGAHAATAAAGTITENIDAMVGAAGQHLREAADGARAVAAQAGDVAMRAIHDGVDRTQALKKNVDGAVTARPFTAIMLAAGAGFLVGMMFRRR